MVESAKQYTELQNLRSKIIDYGLIVGSVIGIVTYLLSLHKINELGFQISYLTDFFVVSGIVVITISRRKINIQLKTLVILLSLFLLIIIDLLQLGVLAGNKVFIVLIPFFSLIVFSLKRTILLFLLAIAIYFGIGWLTVTGHNTLLRELPTDVTSFFAWLINGLIITIVTFVILIVSNRFNKAYEKLFNDLETRNKKIAEKERNYREIFEASTDAIFVHDLEGNILDVNKSMLKMYGYHQSDIPSLNIAGLSSGKNEYTIENAAKKVKLAISGEDPVFDWQAKRKNGEYFWVEVALKKTTIGGDERILAIIRDITEKKEDAMQLALYRNHLKELVAQRTTELEQANEELLTSNDKLAQQKEELISTINKLESTQNQLVQSEKMASLGVLAAGVAHEINNPLNFIKGGTIGIEQYLEMQMPEHLESLKPLLNGINEGVERATNIITSLNHYSRNGNDKTETCDIHAIIDNCLTILNAQLRHKIDVKKEYCSKVHILNGNEGRLHQVILNVLNNSIQALNEKGAIEINTKIIDNFIAISIKDNGIGISEENLGRIFDPFFTTKEAGQGTGLGLSISSKIIQEHNGKIEYESELNHWTEAKISLPIKIV